jgi:peptidoglycan/xylan/chitin deacetylase (PgdA/CDA1 family)
MYHRINDSDLDPWGLCVQPNHFAEHLKVLQKVAVPLSLQKFTRAHEARKLPANAVAITFDDGYANNMTRAKQVLERFDTPATIFVVSGYVGRRREFWWDELEQILLCPSELPEKLELRIGRQNCCWDLGNATRYGAEDYSCKLKIKAWDAKPGSRQHLFYAIWKALWPLTEEERVPLLDAVASWAHVAPALRESRRPLEKNELQTLARCDLIEIGAHTVSHPLLPAHSVSLQAEEIQQSKKQIERLIESTVTSFAYPHGEYAKETLAVVKEAGFARACTTLARAVHSNMDLFELPRFQVENWDGNEFEKRLKRWLHY